jgi:citrate lyase subunit beta / citryl-CoA lyase
MDSSSGLIRSHYAGSFGSKVRSDCRVTLELCSSGGLRLELRSKVAPSDGDSIREQASAELKQLGVEHASVLIEDSDAPLFVISARIETAARRAGFKPGARKAATDSQRQAQSPRDRLRRSRLYVPGSEPKYFLNAVLHQPDAIIFDLEDAVHPAEKDAARILVRNALAKLSFAAPGPKTASCERMVRINQFPLGIEDLDEIIPENPDVILIPKAETAEQIAAVESRIAEIQQGCGRSIWLMPIIESALGVENAFLLASASPKVCSLAIGLEDYTADLGVVKTESGVESLYARARVVNAARAAGVQANDSAYGNIGDRVGLTNWALAARALGFDGMGCVHPLQIEPIHTAFAPSAQEIEKAQRIVEAFQAAAESGSGVIALGSKMIDRPVVNRALKMLETARTMGVMAEQSERTPPAPEISRATTSKNEG